MALGYHSMDLAIAKEIGDRAGIGKSYRNLGTIYKSIGEFRMAIEYHLKDLQIAIEIGRRRKSKW